MNRSMNKKLTFKAVMLSAMFLLPAMAQAESIPVVGLDKNNKEKAVMVTESEFMTVVGDVINSVNDSTIQTLQKQDSGAFVPYWMLRDVCVGLGFTFSAGLGPIWSMTAAPRVRLGYSNSTHPVIPD